MQYLFAVLVVFVCRLSCKGNLVIVILEIYRRPGKGMDGLRREVEDLRQKDRRISKGGWSDWKLCTVRLPHTLSRNVSTHAITATREVI